MNKKHIKSNSLSNNVISFGLGGTEPSVDENNENNLDVMLKNSRSMSTNIRQSLGNGSERGDQEHQIRIEISKTEVLDSMKKDQLKDLSLLYYDFNNSKARLMSKMKKMSDFIIKEEAGDDGDGAAQHLES